MDTIVIVNKETGEQAELRRAWPMPKGWEPRLQPTQITFVMDADLTWDDVDNALTHHLGPRETSGLDPMEKARVRLMLAKADHRQAMATGILADTVRLDKKPADDPDFHEVPIYQPVNLDVCNTDEVIESLSALFYRAHRDGSLYQPPGRDAVGKEVAAILRLAMNK